MVTASSTVPAEPPAPPRAGVPPASLSPSPPSPAAADVLAGMDSGLVTAVGDYVLYHTLGEGEFGKYVPALVGDEGGRRRGREEKEEGERGDGSACTPRVSRRASVLLAPTIILGCARTGGVAVREGEGREEVPEDLPFGIVLGAERRR